MNKLDEMWAALATYQPQADAEGHGKTWATMCQEKTSDAAYAAAYAAMSADDVEADRSAAGAAYAYAYAKAYAAEADKYVQSVIDRINKLKENT